MKEDLYQAGGAIVGYLSTGKAETEFAEGKVLIRLMLDKEEAAHKKEFSPPPLPPEAEKAPSRLYYSRSGSNSNGSSSAKQTQKEKPKPETVSVAKPSAPTTQRARPESKARISEEDYDDILDRLIYVKNRLMLKNNGDEQLISRLFSVETLATIARTTPRDLTGLRMLIETRKWSADENRTFVRHGDFFVQEINHYLRTYTDIGEPTEKEEIPARPVADEDTELINMILMMEDNEAVLAADNEDDGKRKHGEAFAGSKSVAGPGDKNKRYKRQAEEFL